MDKLQEFINKYNGARNVGTTPENTGQCVGIIQKWLAFIYPNAPYIWGHAYQLLTGADKNFYTRVVNTPTGVPPRGSVMVWKKSFNGTFGHTAIVTRADVNTFEVFEQNNPTGSGCRLHTYPNYTHVDGWIIPKTQPVGNSDYYKGYDLTNKDSMRVAVDILVRVQAGELVDKSLLQAALDKVKQLEGHKCPSYGQAKERIRGILGSAREEIDKELVKID